MKEDDMERIKAYMQAKMAHIKMYNECMNLADGLDVEKFAELVRADEREACARVCEEEWGRWAVPATTAEYNRMWRECAQAIRERGDK